MKRILAYTVGVLFIVVGLVAVLWPVEMWRMYDANWRPLAMTEAENYCTGKYVAENAFTQKPSEEVAVCIENSDKGDTPSIVNSQRWFCDGLRAVSPTYTSCMSDVQGFQVWGLADGGWTRSWNDTNAYPEILDYDFHVAPRGSGRDNDTNRDNSGRMVP